MERLTERFDGWVMRKGCHGPCGTCNGAKCTDIYPMIDRLAAYEDAMPIERAQEIAQAEKDGRLAMLPPNAPLTLEELREMEGEPVWVTNENGQDGCWVINDGISCSVMHIAYGYLAFGNYGKTWLAYRRKPEEVGT